LPRRRQDRDRRRVGAYQKEGGTHLIQFGGRRIKSRLYFTARIPRVRILGNSNDDKRDRLLIIVVNCNAPSQRITSLEELLRKRLVDDRRFEPARLIALLDIPSGHDRGAQGRKIRRPNGLELRAAIFSPFGNVALNVNLPTGKTAAHDSSSSK
jgi:hypothetical protein